MSRRPLAKVVGEKVIPITSIRANPWNVNVMDNRTYAATRESIRLNGFVDPVTVRAIPPEGEEGVIQYEIIDGEHRWQAAHAEGLTEIGVLVVEVASEAHAKKLTLLLNVHGTGDLVKVAGLVAEFAAADLDRAGYGLAYSSRQLTDLIELGRKQMPNYEAEDPGVLLTFHVSAEQHMVITQAIARAMASGESLSRGVALERISADYLAG